MAASIRNPSAAVAVACLAAAGWPAMAASPPPDLPVTALDRVMPSAPSVPKPAGGDETGAPLDRLRAVVSAMGYVVTDAGPDYLDFASGRYEINLALSHDTRIVYAILHNLVPPEKLPRVPYRDLMAWNAEERSYFGLSTLKDGSSHIYLMSQVYTKDVTAVELRDVLDRLTNDADRKADIFDPARWK